MRQEFCVGHISKAVDPYEVSSGLKTPSETRGSFPLNYRPAWLCLGHVLCVCVLILAALTWQVGDNTLLASCTGEAT